MNVITVNTERQDDWIKSLPGHRGEVAISVEMAEVFALKEKLALIERDKGAGLMSSDPKDCPSCPTLTQENYMKLLNGTATQVETIDGDMVGVGDAPFNIAHASDEEPDLD